MEATGSTGRADAGVGAAAVIGATDGRPGGAAEAGATRIAMRLAAIQPRITAPSSDFVVGKDAAELAARTLQELARVRSADYAGRGPRGIGEIPGWASVNPRFPLGPRRRLPKSS